MKSCIKKCIPKSVLNFRHLFFAWWGAVKYNHPSRELLVIGVTGTSGKSSTVCFLRQLLEHAGFTVGSLSTIDFYIAGENKLNDKKMTMLGRSAIQQYLRDMVDAGCDIAIVETTSEGRVQHRHRCIEYDMMLLTNLYPEHIDSHGSFEKYKQAKKDIFTYVAKRRHKHLDSFGDIPKRAFVNGNTEYAAEFLEASFDERYIFSRVDQKNTIPEYIAQDVTDTVVVDDPHVSKEGLSFSIDGVAYSAPMYAEHNIMNISGALAVLSALGIETSVQQSGVAALESPAGRVEEIKEAAKYKFQVIVDYAFEPGAMAGLYSVVELLNPKRVIHVFGSTGGGRDIERRFSVGRFVGERADICIITDEDPYDDDPQTIIDDVARAVQETGKKMNTDLFTILDRRKAIQKAIDLATPGDLVLVTGKGSEQAMVVKGKLIPWDDRKEVQKALEKK